MKELKTIRDLLLALLEGYEVENYFESQSIWETVDSICFDTRYLDDEEALQGRYRIKPTKPSIDWTQVSEEYQYLARDASGEVFLFKDRPNQAKQIWLPEVGGAINASIFKALEAGNCDWRDSLVERPKD